MDDETSKIILRVVNSANEPLETKEVEEKMKGTSRSKIMYRLNQLRAEGKIKGKFIGSGKKTWLWWKDDAFSH